VRRTLFPFGAAQRLLHGRPGVSLKVGPTFINNFLHLSGAGPSFRFEPLLIFAHPGRLGASDLLTGGCLISLFFS